MYYRCELLVDGLKYRVTDDLENWDDVKASFKRGDYDGVVRTFSNKFSFAGGARDLLMRQYKEKYLNASASVVISTRNNSWLYNERFSCALNFSTLQDDGHLLQINAVDDSVAALIKAKKGTQYEYVVDEIKSEKRLFYDGIEIHNTTEWILTGETSDDGTSVDIGYIANIGKQYIPLYISKSDVLVKGGMDVSDTDVDGDPKGLFIKAFSKMYIRLRVSIAMRINRERASVTLYKYDLNLNPVELKSVLMTNTQETKFEFDEEIELNDGDMLAMSMSTVYDITLTVKSESFVRVEWDSRNNPVFLDVIGPITLLNRLLKSINGGKDGLTGVIENPGDNRLSQCMLLAAESARKIPGAKVYSSFTKFANWMSYVFGYAYDISGNTVTFRHRSSYFTDKVVKKIDDLSDYEMSVNSSLVYSRVRIGYDKQDYDTANGKDEFRFTNEYTTGVNMTDNSLEMISPYRADAYGIEFLVDKIGQDTTDNESDTDLFMVGVNDTLSRVMYFLDRDTKISGVLSPGTMFNAMYSPSSMILANEGYIGVSAEVLTFASSDGNSGVVIGGVSESRDIILSKRMFTVAEVEFETSDVELPDDMTGIVEFEYQGETVQGYYQQADYNFMKGESSKVTLIVKGEKEESKLES